MYYFNKTKFMQNHNITEDQLKYNIDLNHWLDNYDKELVFKTTLHNTDIYFTDDYTIINLEDCDVIGEEHNEYMEFAYKILCNMNNIDSILEEGGHINDNK